MPVTFGLIGYPLSHSFSKDYFSRKFETLGLHAYSYNVFEIREAEQLMDVIRENPSLQGLNVTVPHKVSVMKFLDVIDEEALAAGAVNTIRIYRNGNSFSTKGFNTDIYGFEKSIKPFMEPHHQRAMVLGNGGAARAVKFVLRKLGIDFITVARNGSGDLLFEEVTPQLLKHYFFIIQTTPVGTFPNINATVVFPFENLSPAHFCVDLIYNPPQTLFLQQAAKYGAKILNGLDMLHFQAEKSFQIWTTHE